MSSLNQRFLFIFFTNSFKMWFLCFLDSAIDCKLPIYFLYISMCKYSFWDCFLNFIFDFQQNHLTSALVRIPCVCVGCVSRSLLTLSRNTLFSFLLLHFLHSNFVHIGQTIRWCPTRLMLSAVIFKLFYFLHFSLNEFYWH